LFCWYFSFHNAKIIAHGFTFVKLFMRKSVIIWVNYLGKPGGLVRQSGY
jgi:hypothetical protein